MTLVDRELRECRYAFRPHQLVHHDQHVRAHRLEQVRDALDERVTNLLQAMRTDVLVVMNELMRPEGVSAFTKLAVDERHARTRALSLVAVDAITRPEDYEHSLFVCERCKQP